MGELREVPLMPAVIPFGENIVMTASSMRDGRAVIVVRAVGDDFIGTPDPAKAWEANERADGPAWFLSFATAASCRNMAATLTELADALTSSPTNPLNPEMG